MDITANQIKLKEHLGIVTSDANSLKFNFFVTPLIGKLSVEEGNYVLLPHPTLGDSYPVIAQVTEIKNYEEVVGTTLNEKAVHTTAVGKILGYVESKKEKRYLRKLFSPPTPGSKVYLPYLDFIEDIFCRNPQGQPFKHALQIGELESVANTKKGPAKAVKFYLDADEFTKQHYLISAMSGTGKTHTAIVLIEELANKTTLPVIVFDPNKEYLQIGVTKELFNKLDTKRKLKSSDYPFKFKVSAYTQETNSVSQLQGKNLNKNAKSKINLKPISTLWNKKTSKPKETEISEELKKSMKSSKVTIIDSKSLNFDERKTLFSSCLKSLLKCRAESSIEPFILIIEDANQVDSKTLESLVVGSRTIGVSMILITQHPSELKSRVLSQVGTQIMGRTTDQHDLSCLANMALDKTNLLPRLRTGEWIINGITMKEPTKVLMREQYSKKTSIHD